MAQFKNIAGNPNVAVHGHPGIQHSILRCDVDHRLVCAAAFNEHIIRNLHIPHAA
ncbi:hypothetical protein D3C75_1277140 [compost metagenome]